MKNIVISKFNYYLNRKEMNVDMKNNQIVKAYSINEVSMKINTPTGTIRQWEKDLSGLLVIPRTKQGARYYTDKEIGLLEKIKEMRNQNIHKGMIRSLLEKHLNQPSESIEINNKTTIEKEIIPQSDPSPSNQENQSLDINMSIETFKQDLLNEFKNEMVKNRKELIAEIKNELSTHSLTTVQEISKSIQRSNDKRKGEIQVISDTINHVSELTSEGFETLSKTISKTSQITKEQVENLSNSIKITTEETFENLSKHMDESSMANQTTLGQVTETVGDIKYKLSGIAKTLEKEQKQILQNISELKESTAKIHQREDSFQKMVASLREVAATKNEKKNWWKFWK